MVPRLQLHDGDHTIINKYNTSEKMLTQTGEYRISCQGQFRFQLCYLNSGRIGNYITAVN